MTTPADQAIEDFLEQPVIDEGAQTGTDGNVALELIASAEAAGGDESDAEESAEDAAMFAGYKQATGEEVQPLTDKEPVAAAPSLAPVPADKIVFAGLTEAQLQAKLDKIESLEKGSSTLAGRLGHLQQMLESGKGKTITAEMLGKVSAEFGQEYAQALADDLNAAGIGGGQVLDTKVIADLVNEEVSKRDEERERKFEFKASWDSDTVSGYLTEFKDQRDKAAAQAARQTSRVARAVVPQGTAASTQPSADPLEAGWNRAKGVQARGAGVSRMAGGR